MKKYFLFTVFVILANSLSAQLIVSVPIDKYKSDYGIGAGAYLSYSFYSSDAADITAELGATVFSSVYSSGVGTASLKAGYRYTLNKSGFGLYVHPQLGFGIMGEGSESVMGGVAAGGVGYLFRIGDTPVDAGLVVETARGKDFSLTFASLRVAWGIFLFGRKNRE